MGQMTIYLDELDMREIRKSAKQEHVSVSRWARRRLCEAVRHAWPPGYFALFGELKDGDLVRPPQTDLGVDPTRRPL
jgi:hypothetical protein